MLGAIIGDIVGSKYEFNNTFDYNFDSFDIPKDIKDKAMAYLPDDMKDIYRQFDERINIITK